MWIFGGTLLEIILRTVFICVIVFISRGFAGNRKIGKYENTFCPSCGETLIERFGFHVSSYKLKNGACFKCGTKIPGRWE